MRTLLIPIRDEMFRELVHASRQCCANEEECAPAPEEFARECIESALASRRLERRAAL